VAAGRQLHYEKPVTLLNKVQEHVYVHEPHTWHRMMAYAKENQLSGLAILSLDCEKSENGTAFPISAKMVDHFPDPTADELDIWLG